VEGFGVSSVWMNMALPCVTDTGFYTVWS